MKREEKPMGPRKGKGDSVFLFFFTLERGKKGFVGGGEKRAMGSSRRLLVQRKMGEELSPIIYSEKKKKGGEKEKIE